MGSSDRSTQYRKRDPEPQELINLRQKLYEQIMPGLESFSAEDWNKAKETASNALSQQSQLVSQIPSALEGIQRSGELASEIANVARTGNIPSAMADRLNASVNQSLQSGLGSMLNGLASRGVLNSSITGQGINNLSQSAADAYNRNYMTAYQAVLGGLGQAMQGQQSSANAYASALTSGMKALGAVPEDAYTGAISELMPAYNFWKDWQKSYDGREDYDTVVTQGGGSCITGETRVRLADGREIPVSELKETDKIQAWDFERGCVVSAPLTAFFRDIPDGGADVIRVEFEDGSSVGVIYEHLFFDLTEGKFVAVNAGSVEFIGHEFAKASTDGKITGVKVTGIRADGKANETYAPQCEGHLNFIAEGFITGNDGQLGLCNRFDYDTDKMTYDAVRQEADMMKYGILEYGELDDVISKDFYMKNKCYEFRVAIGKGLMTFEQLREYLSKYAGYFIEKGGE